MQKNITAIVLVIAMLLGILVPTIAWAQDNPNSAPPMEEVAGNPTDPVAEEKPTTAIEDVPSNLEEETIPPIYEETAGEKDDLTEEKAPFTPSPQPIVSFNTTGYTVLEDGTSAIVYTFSQLKEAIEKDNGILTVYLGADITIAQNRTTIPSTKPTFTLSGKNPLTGDGFTITEYSDPGLANIVLPNGNNNTRKVTLADLHIVSRGSYYGLLGVEDGVQGVEYYVRNVTYTGRQFLYALYSHVYFEGENSITINQSTNGNAGQEVLEALHVTVTGKLDIQFYATGYPVFKMNFGKSTFTVKGVCNITAPSIPASLGVIIGSAGENAVSIRVAENAKLYIVANNRLVNEVADSLTVEKNATFHFEKTGGQRNDTHAAIRLRQKLFVDEGATFYLKQSATGASYLFRFYLVPTGLSGGVMAFNNPKLVTLINEGDRQMVYGEKAEVFNAIFETMSYYKKGQNPEADMPLYTFDMADTPEKAPISLSMVHRAGVPTSLNTNHPGITMQNMLLDATPGAIVFGKAITTISFLGKQEDTGQPLEGFFMESITVDRNTEAPIQPAKVLGFVITGYGVGDGDIQRLMEDTFSLMANQRYITVTLYYQEPVLDVSVPTKLLFTATPGSDGQVSAPTYHMENKSNVDIDLVLLSVIPAADNRVELVPQGTGAGEQLSLGILPQKQEFSPVDVFSALTAEQALCRLGNRWKQAENQYTFTLTGQYYGVFSKDAQWPKYQLSFAFRMAE
ncbi:hypothetical protein LJC20_01260 [Eubacteriales bacterium OttesenSCG-928-M02]|nr:hypothetical protein [Eubacteriales bacterium OttesenSCG-928-M02]